MPFKKEKIVVNVPKRSGFDKSHRNSGTLKVGTLTPILCDEVIPGTRASLRLNLAAQLPPLVSDTYMNLRMKAEAFFVPSRLTCKSFESFFCDSPERIFSYVNDVVSADSKFVEVKGAVPCALFDAPSTALNDSSFLGPGSLMDYLGFKSGVAVGHARYVNLMPVIAYHLIYDRWYRNARVQNPVFAKNDYSISDPSGTFNRTTCRVLSAPYNFYHHGYTNGSAATIPANFAVTVTNENISDYKLADGVNLFSLRQRNFGTDLFTGARVDAQQGGASAVTFNAPVTPGTSPAPDVASGEITIAAIRAANSLQQFRERNNLASPRMVDQVKARYNANLSDGVAQYPICIGSATYDVSSRGIDQTAAIDSGPNPFSGMAAQYGRAYSAGSDFIIKDFTANEPGYLMVIISLVPEVTYSSGIDPIFDRYTKEGSIVEMACSLLQNVGDEPIYVDQLLKTSTSGSDGVVFGYQDRFCQFMFKPNQAHGKFRDGESLESFVLQRSFSQLPELSTEFLQIPTTYLDGVMTVTSAVSGVSAWYDCMLDYKVSMPLAEFSIPSLQDPAYEHGERVVLNRNGQIF